MKLETFLDQGDFDRLQDTDELYIRSVSENENFDVCNMGCCELPNPKEVAQEIVRRVNLHEELTDKLDAIKARFNGEWDNPALLKYGLLNTNLETDLNIIINRVNPI